MQVLVGFFICFHKNNFTCLYNKYDPFTISVVLHLSGTFVSGKMTILQKKLDAYNCSTTSFYRKGIITTHECRTAVIVKGSIEKNE